MLRQRRKIKPEPALLESAARELCGDNTSSEAAHIRTGHIEHGKDYTGMGQKPDDKWTLSLCNRHHREQHGMNELAFWKLYGIDPFMKAIQLRTR